MARAGDARAAARCARATCAAALLALAAPASAPLAADAAAETAIILQATGEKLGAAAGRYYEPSCSHWLDYRADSRGDRAAPEALLFAHPRAGAPGGRENEEMTVTIRTIEPRDEARWREMWRGYLGFYGTPMPEAVTRHTWARILDPAVPMHAIVAEQPEGGTIGFANYVLHENTWSLAPVCYLEDLYVDEARRARGVGKSLIDWLVAKMKAERWARLYWATRETNYRARGLYDKYTPHSGFLRYVIMNPDAPRGD
jgi:GNAT superfamily N-acetyltransferase